MPAVPLPLRSTEAEYLALEMASPERNELIDGVIVAMAGASKLHNMVAGNLFSLLRTMAAPHGCETYIEGVRLRIDDATHVYPDVMVVCEDNDDEYAVSNPCMVAEVLSPSTSWVDHGRKRIAYLRIASLRDYLLINTVDSVAEHYTRSSAESAFTYTVVAQGETVKLSCPPGSFSLDAIFSFA